MNESQADSPNPSRQVNYDTKRDLFSYFVVLILYIILGYNFKTVFLNWIIGPLFLVITLYYIPMVFRIVFTRREAKK